MAEGGGVRLKPRSPSARHPRRRRRGSRARSRRRRRRRRAFGRRLRRRRAITTRRPSMDVADRRAAAPRRGSTSCRRSAPDRASRSRSSASPGGAWAAERGRCAARARRSAPPQRRSRRLARRAAVSSPATAARRHAGHVAEPLSAAPLAPRRVKAPRRVRRRSASASHDRRSNGVGGPRTCQRSLASHGAHVARSTRRRPPRRDGTRRVGRGWRRARQRRQATRAPGRPPRRSTASLPLDSDALRLDHAPSALGVGVSRRVARGAPPSRHELADARKTKTRPGRSCGVGRGERAAAVAAPRPPP